MKNFICTVLSIMCLVVFSSATIVIKDSEVTISNETATFYTTSRYESEPGTCRCGLFLPAGGNSHDESLFSTANIKPILMNGCCYGNQKTVEYRSYVYEDYSEHSSSCNWRGTGPASYYATTSTYTTYYNDNGNPISQLNLRNCIIKTTLTSYRCNVTITGGKYSGAPALDSDKITVTKGTLTDLNGRHSTYLLGEDSEETSAIAESGSTPGTTTVTTVKLSNPPVIIDWSEFPGIDIDIDLNAPTIEVTREPASTVTPTDRVKLTVRAEDPDGHGTTNCISINGGSFQPSGTSMTFTDNQTVSIVARDANGNTRSYNVDISNIDMEAPEVVDIHQSNTAWTKNPVTVTVDARDDTKLHAQAYQFQFTPNSRPTSPTTTSWQATRSYRVTENGTLRVKVRDVMGKESAWSEDYRIANIDKIAPTGTVTFSVPSGTQVNSTVGVTVQVNINDVADPITMETCGLNNQPVMWDTTVGQWSADTEKTYHENGTYSIKVRDALSNQSSNITFTINQIVGADKKPRILGFGLVNPSGGWMKAPAVLKIEAQADPSTQLADRPYSWDGGNTWTSIPQVNIYNNGEYTVLVRDRIGNVTEQSCIVDHIDNQAPSASVYLYKGAPNDWDYTIGNPEVADYVWKIRVEASDVGSEIDHIETMWDGGTHTTLPIIQEIEEPGVYGVTVYDNAGNKTYVEKVVDAESIGLSPNGGNGTSGAYTDIKVPPTGTAGTDPWPEGASLQDLIFTDDGILNNGKVPPEYRPYPAGKEGIPVNVLFTGKRNNYVTGYATFNGVKYPVTFPDNGGAEYCVATGRQQPAQVFIPISTVNQDVKNGRIKIVFQEWTDDTKSTLAREGSATLYTSVQKSDPNISWTYNKATDQITVIATSPVAGINPDDILIDVGGGYVPYSGPVTVGNADPVKIKVRDKAGNETELIIPADELQRILSGVAGGTLTPIDISSLPGGGEGLNSYHISNRAADIYIIGGTRGNTNSVPPGDIYDTAG